MKLFAYWHCHQNWSVFILKILREWHSRKSNVSDSHHSKSLKCGLWVGWETNHTNIKCKLATFFKFTNMKLKFQPGSLHEILYAAIKQDRVDFVDLLLDCGTSIKAFLTSERLLMLYNTVSHVSYLCIRVYTRSTCFTCKPCNTVVYTVYNTVSTIQCTMLRFVIQK